MTARLLTDAFPDPGPRLTHAFQILDAAQRDPDLAKKLDLQTLPRPWQPDRCLDPDLRRDLWDWLGHVVTWLNDQYAWDPEDLIPGCWPDHPHLIREVAVVADQYRVAQSVPHSTLLEEWHRYTLPMFSDRMRRRLRSHCRDGHAPNPGTARHRRDHDKAAALREAAITGDINAAEAAAATGTGHRARLALLNMTTGVVEELPTEGPGTPGGRHGPRR